MPSGDGAASGNRARGGNRMSALVPVARRNYPCVVNFSSANGGIHGLPCFFFGVREAVVVWAERLAAIPKYVRVSLGGDGQNDCGCSGAEHEVASVHAVILS
mgnify:CR=1 FL=1